MKQILTIENDLLKLNTHLTEYSFGKTKSYNITEQGFIFDKNSFLPWSFREVKSYLEQNENKEENHIVYFIGENPFTNNAKTLSQFFEDNSFSNEKLQAVKLIISAINFACVNSIDLPKIGAGGILIDLSQEKVFFAPESLFLSSVNFYSKEEYLLIHEGWINSSLNGLPFLCFERAVIIYYLLTNKFPFSSISITERNADILDKKFLPLDLLFPSIDSFFANKINKSLRLNSNVVLIPGKKQKGKSSDDLTPEKDFSIEKLDSIYEEISQNNLETIDEEKIQNYLKNQQSKVNTKRTLRRNVSLILTSICSFLIILLIIINTIKSKQDEFTSKGLTSTQVVQAFFYGVNTKDTVLLTNFTKGKKISSYIDSVGSVFVLDKQRKAYQYDNGFATPENWLIYCNSLEKFDNSGLYGITNLKINGEQKELYVEMLKQNQKPLPVTDDYGNEIPNKTQTQHLVQYFLLHTEGEENNFIIEQITEVFTLTFAKNRWQITNIETESKVIPVRCNEFKNEYVNSLEKNNGDVITTAEELRIKYNWLPTKYALETEKKVIDEMINNPYAVLGF